MIVSFHNQVTHCIQIPDFNFTAGAKNNYKNNFNYNRKRLTILFICLDYALELLATKIGPKETAAITDTIIVSQTLCAQKGE